MEETDRTPQGDISYIRGILEKTADDMRAAAPWFLRFGVVWLAYGLLTAAQRIGLWFVPAPAASWLSNVFGVLGWLFYIVIAGGYVIVRRKQKRQGSGSLALKLLDAWGVCILLFVALSLCLSVLIPAVHAHILSTPEYERLNFACAAAQSYLFFLLPAAPLLITAVFLEKRWLMGLGIVIAVIAAALLGLNTLLLFSGGQSIDSAWVWLSNAAACLLDLAPGGMLLLYARSLKRG